MASVDYVILAAYLLFLLALGPVFNRFNRNASDYFRAGGTMIWWVAGAAVIMGGFSAWAFTGGAARIYETGLFFLVLFVGNLMADFVTIGFLARKFRQMRVVTAVEAIRKRFGPVNEQVFTWVQVPMRLFYAGLGLYTLGVFTQGAFGLDMMWLIVVLGVAVTVMSVSGGAWAINAGQFVQGLLFLFVTIVMVWTTLRHPQIGGLTGLVNQLPAAHFDWTAFERPSILVLFTVTLMINQIIQRNAIQEGTAKFLIVKNGRDAVRVAVVAMISIVILTPMWMIPAMGSVIVHPDLNVDYPALRNANEAAYVAMAQSTLPPGLLGLLICAIFSASLDALSSGINTAAAVLVRNFYLPILNPHASERRQVWMGRTISVVGGVLMVVTALAIGRYSSLPLYSLLITAAAAIGLPQAVPLFLGIFVKKAPSVSLWTTLVLGFGTSLTLGFVLTDGVLNQLWGGEPLSRQEINDLRVAVITGALLVVCIGWFFICTLLATIAQRRAAAGGALAVFRDAPGRLMEVERFFVEMNTPINMAVEHAGEGYEDDARQYHVLAVLSLIFGGFIAVLALVPNSLGGRIGLLLCGGSITAVGALLFVIARRRRVRPAAEVTVGAIA